MTLAPDHADPDRWYAFVETPRVVADPVPRISMVLTRGSAEAGGLLQLECELPLEDAQLAAIREELVREGSGAPVIVAPDWRAGSVHLVGWLASDRLAPVELHTTAPNLVERGRCIVAARLDAASAALAEAALRDDALPVAVVYELETVGLAGPLDVEIEADLQAIHDRLTLAGALTTPYGRAKISATWEEFEREQLIRVKVTDVRGEIGDQRTEALRRVGEELVARMWSPVPPERGPILSDESVATVELSFKLTARREELEGTARWSWRERGARRLVHHAASSLIGVLAGRDASEHVHVWDVAIPRHTLTVRCEPELDALGVVALELELRWPGDETPRGVVLDRATPQVELEVDHPPTAAWEYRVRARFDPARTRVTERVTDWIGARGAFLLVSTRRLFPPRELDVIAGRIERDWIERVEIEGRCGDDLPQVVALDGARREHRLSFPGGGRAPLRVRLRWVGAIDEPSLTVPEIAVDGEILVVDSPFGHSHRVTLVPLPLAGLVALVVELRLEQGDFTDARQIAWDGDDRSPRTVWLRSLPAPAPRISYRVIQAREDGSLVEGPWIEDDRSAIVIGAEDGPFTVRSVEVVALGGGPRGRGSMAIELSLTAGTERRTALLEGAQDRAELVLAAPADTARWTLVAREIDMNGHIRESHFEDPPRLVVLPPP